MPQQLTALAGQQVLPGRAVTDHGKEPAMQRRRVFRLIAILFTMWALLDLSAAEARNPRPPRRCHPGAGCQRGTGVCNDAHQCCSTFAGEVACGTTCCNTLVGNSCCNGACIDTSNDALNCGACGLACIGIGQICVQGACQCPNGMTNCDGECVFLGDDPKNCGSCGNVCPAGQWCDGGDCACPIGQTLCNGACVDLTTDPNNCGACGHGCASGTCTNGTCDCPAGQTNCDGVCVDLNSDQNNCGGCGNVCPAGQDCVDGACQSPRCAPPTTDCGGVWCCNEGQLCLSNEFTGAPLCCTPGFGRHEDCVRLGIPLICCMPQ